jgi:hypothetical protein
VALYGGEARLLSLGLWIKLETPKKKKETPNRDKE